MYLTKTSCQLFLFSGVNGIITKWVYLVNHSGINGVVVFEVFEQETLSALLQSNQL